MPYVLSCCHIQLVKMPFLTTNGISNDFECSEYKNLAVLGCEVYIEPVFHVCISPEIPELADHGITLPPNMQGLTHDQITDLKLRDEWEDNCIPSGGAEFKKDEIGRRNGHGKHPVLLMTSLV